MLRRSLSLALFLAASLTSHAAIIELQFSGAAYFVGSNQTDHFQIGDTYTLTVSYDSTAANEAQVPNEFTFSLLSAQAVVDRQAGGQIVVDFGNPKMYIEDPGSFQRITFSSEPPATAVWSISGESITDEELVSAPLTMFSDTRIITSPPPETLTRTDWSTNTSSSQFSISFIPGVAADRALFTIDEIVVIPEPSTYAMLGLGALAVVLLALRRRR